MTFLVPFDGSELSEAALVRAAEFATVLDERVLAVTVVPRDDVEYAREKGWLDEGEAFDRDAVVGSVHEHVTELHPGADFRHELVSTYAKPRKIAKRVRKVAWKEDASMVFVGSENAGRVVSTLGSVGRSVTADDAYDVVIIRHRVPSKVRSVRENSPHREPKSDFYLPE